MSCAHNRFQCRQNVIIGGICKPISQNSRFQLVQIQRQALGAADTRLIRDTCQESQDTHWDQVPSDSEVLRPRCHRQNKGLPNDNEYAGPIRPRSMAACLVPDASP